MLLKQRLRLRWPRRRLNKVRRLPSKLPSPLAPRSPKKRKRRAALVTSLRSLKRRRRAAINPRSLKRRRRMPAKNLLTVLPRNPLLMENPPLMVNLPLMALPRSPSVKVATPPRSQLMLQPEQQLHPPQQRSE